MSDQRAEEEAHVPWPPFNPEPRLIGDMERELSTKEVEAIVAAAVRRYNGEAPDPIPTWWQRLKSALGIGTQPKDPT